MTTRLATGSWLAMSSAALFLACSSGGGGGEKMPPTLLFYTDGMNSAGLWAVDPTASTPAKIEIQAGTSQVLSPVLVQAGSWGGKSGTIRSVYTRYVVYAQDPGGGLTHLYKLDARASSTTPAPTELSALSNTVCWLRAVPDYSNPGKSLVIANTPGDDLNCGTSDDVEAVVSLSMGASGDPVALPAGASYLGAVRSASSGAISKLLVLAGGHLWAYTPAGASQDLGVVGEAWVVVEWAGRTWLAVDGYLKYYDAAASELKDPLDGSFHFPDSTVFAVDETHLYFAGTSAGAAIQGILLDGSAESYTIHALDGTQSITSLRAALTRLVYRDAGTEIWYSVPKTGGDPTQVFAPIAAGDQVTLWISGAWLYFADFNLTILGVAPPSWTTENDAALVNEDGTGEVDFTGDGSNAYGWTVIGDSTVRMSAGRVDSPRYALLVDQGDSGTTLTTYDGPTGSQLAALGSLPGVTVSPVSALAEGSGDATIFLAGSGPATVSFGKASTADSLVLLEDSTAALAPVGTSGGSVESCSTGGAGGLAAIALALLGYRRRRAAR